MVFWLRSMNGWMLRFGLDTVSTPAIPPPASRIGAATYITVLFSSSGSSRVERAPYCPRRVRWTSFQRELSRPISLPAESNTTIPRASVMVTR